MAFTRNVNKALSLSFGSCPISVERRGRMLDADWIWAGADGARNRAWRANCVRRHDSQQRFAQSRAASGHMLKAYVMNSVMNFLNQSHSYWESWFFIERKDCEVQKIFDPTVFNEKHADNIGSAALCKFLVKSLFQSRVVTAAIWIVFG